MAEESVQLANNREGSELERQPPHQPPEIRVSPRRWTLLLRIFVIVVVLVAVDAVILGALFTVSVSKTQKINISIDVSAVDIVEANTSFSYGWVAFQHSGIFEFFWHTTTFYSANLSIWGLMDERVYSSGSPAQYGYGFFVVPYTPEMYDFVVVEDQNITHADTIMLTGTLFFSGPLL